MKNKKFVIIACAILLIAGSIYYFIQDNPAKIEHSAQETAENVPTFIGNSIVEEENGKRLWELKAERIEVDPQTKAVKMFNLKGIFYKDDGGKIEITAPEASMDTKTRDIFMSGGIKALNSDGAAFTAQEAHWEGKRRYLTGTGGVKLTKDDTVITGDRLESDDKMEKVKVEGNAHVVKGGIAN